MRRNVSPPDFRTIPEISTGPTGNDSGNLIVAAWIPRQIPEIVQAKPKTKFRESTLAPKERAKAQPSVSLPAVPELLLCSVTGKRRVTQEKDLDSQCTP
jgi:hypothetical protein